jgi:hypothetical protein
MRYGMITGVKGAMLVPIMIVHYALLLACLIVFMPAVKVVFVRTGSGLTPFFLPSIARVMLTRPVEYAKLAFTCFMISISGKLLPYLLCYLPLGLVGPWAFFSEAYAIGRFTGWLDGQEKNMRP